MADLRVLLAVVAAATCLLAACREDPPVPSAPIPDDDTHRYVLLLDGIGSTGEGVDRDFADITARLREMPELRRVVQFSYGAAKADGADKACAGWQDCDWRGQAVYDDSQVSGPSADEQVVTLDWLLGQIRQEDPAARVDLVSFSLGGVVASRWASTIGLTDTGRSRGVGSLVLIGSPVGGSPQANACVDGAIGICPRLRQVLGAVHLEELQLPVGPGEPPASIVPTLAGATSAYDVTAIESQADYLVNGLALPTGFGPAPVASGTQLWPSGRLTRHADHGLGGDLITDPINLLDLQSIITTRHNPPLHHTCTVAWVYAALSATTAPACTAPSLAPPPALPALSTTATAPPSDPRPPAATTTEQQPVGDVPDAFLGTWSGGITQENPPIPPFSLTVTLRQGPTGSTVATGNYTGTSPCAVSWRLLSAEPDRLRVNEDVQTGNCFDDIEVTLTTRDDGSLSYEFEDGNGRGILTRDR